MAAPVSSKNPYDILGNDIESDEEKPPVKVVDKAQSRSTKRNNPDVAPSGPKSGAAGDRGARRGGAGGNEGAFRDRNAGSANNRNRSDDFAGRQDRVGRDQERRRGGRGGRGGGGRGGYSQTRDDRSGRTDTEKSISQGWGGNTGESEWVDEKEGEALAKAEEADASGEATAAAGEENAEPEAEAEPEDNTKSYAEYLAEQEANRDSSLGLLQARKPSEGKQSKQWAKAKPLEKEEEEEYFAGGGLKNKRERQRKEKSVVEIDQRYVEPSGGRGGGGGRGGSRGGRGDRGGFRGGRGRGEGRGEYRGRGGRGGPSGGAQFNVQDTNAFPSLG